MGTVGGATATRKGLRRMRTARSVGIVATVVVRARSHNGEPIEVEVGADQVVLRPPPADPRRSNHAAAEGRAAREEALSRHARPVVVVEVSAPRMRLRPGLRVPIGGGRARVVWFDHRHERDLVVRALVRTGWEVRPRRWPFVILGVDALVLAALAVAVSWILAVLLLVTAVGCVLHLVRNEQGARVAAEAA